MNGISRGSGFPYILLRKALLFPAIHKIRNTKQNLQQRGRRRGKAYHENVTVEPPAEQIRQGYADQKGAGDSLQHHKVCSGAAVEIADEAEKECG